MVLHQLANSLASRLEFAEGFPCQAVKNPALTTRSGRRRAAGGRCGGRGRRGSLRRLYKDLLAARGSLRMRSGQSDARVTSRLRTGASRWAGQLPSTSAHPRRAPWWTPTRNRMGNLAKRTRLNTTLPVNNCTFAGRTWAPITVGAVAAPKEFGGVAVGCKRRLLGDSASGSVLPARVSRRRAPLGAAAVMAGRHVAYATAAAAPITVSPAISISDFSLSSQSTLVSRRPCVQPERILLSWPLAPAPPGTACACMCRIIAVEIDDQIL